MCGIIGFVTKEKKELAPKIIASLVDLEYRGYDSAGLAILDEKGSIKDFKCLGAPSMHLSLETMYDSWKNKVPILSRTGIGHNRWATHGRPSLANAHPHSDCAKEITIVHNGTIVNYESIKNELTKKGHVFLSETDTEVIPHLLEEYVKTGSDFETAFKQTATRLEGSFGIVALYARTPGRLYIAKNGSPISIGVGKDELIVASSTNALVRYTDRYITLEDGEYAILDGDTLAVEVKRWETNRRQIKVEQLIEGVVASDLSKGDYETFMLKEIYEQPSSTKTTLLGRFDVSLGNVVLGGLTDEKDFLQQITHLYIVGCGSAYNAACVGKSIIESLTDIVISAEIASEFRYDKHQFPKDKTAVFVISQSGETADTLESVKDLKKKGYKTFGIVNVVGSAISLETDAGIFTRAGSEIGVASTKAFTAQLSVLYLLGIYFARMRTLSPQTASAYLETLSMIHSSMEKTLSETEETVQRLVDEYKNTTSIQFLGKGIHVAIAKEAALKFKELTYIEVGSYPLGELKHGPIAVIDEQTLSVVCMPKDELFALNKNTIAQIKSKGGRVCVITDKAGSAEVMELADAVIVIPTLSSPLIYPLIEIIPLQLFSYYFARALGHNIDKPRNLAKSVTVQ